MTKWTSTRTKLIFQIVVSVLVLVSSLWIVLSNSYPDAHLKWAFGMVGVVIGYWLR